MILLYNNVRWPTMTCWTMPYNTVSNKRLKDLITERQERLLRNRQFIRNRTWKSDSIADRLAKRANIEIKNIEIARSKKGLAKKYRNTIVLIEYVTPCTKL